MKKNILPYIIAALLAWILIPAQMQAQIAVVPVCDGAEVCLTVGTFRGSIQWQSSPDSVTWSNIPGGTSDTLCFFANTATYYRAEITEGTCAPIYTDIQAITLYTVSVDAGVDGQGCLGGTATLGGFPTASGGIGGFTYDWQLGGATVATTANPTVTLPGLNNIFVVTATDSQGCAGTDTVEVSAYAITAHAGPDTAGCNGSNITLGGSPTASGGVSPYQYVWYQNGAPIDTNANPSLPIGPALNTYTLVVTDSNGCMAMDTVLVDTGGSAVPGTLTFAFTGAPQLFVVPACVFEINATVSGAQGGSNWVNNDNFGGEYTGTIPVTPGETLWVYVGGQPNTIAGGYNGGGGGEAAGKGGGGATDIRRAGNTLNDRVLVAGGGGGAGFWSSMHVVGGKGGGLTGGNGYRDTPSTPGGLGANQTGPGANGTCVSLNNPAMAGAFGTGGSSNSCGCEGYGGGGGWYGGAGSGNCRGGGGGSGYAAPGVTNTSSATGVKTGNGQAIISW
jgi:hypothetical protein